MEEQKVKIAPFVNEKLNKLITTLFEKEYFSFIENAYAYIDEIYNFIYTIPDIKKYRTRNKNQGEWYCRFQPNKHTRWYVIFDIVDERFIVFNIINNHTEDYPKFISEQKSQ